MNEVIKNKKRVLIIAGGTYVSGAEKVTLDVANSMISSGYDVQCMVSGWNDGDFIKRLEGQGVRCHAIKLGWYYITKFFWSLDSFVNYPKAIYQSYSLLKKLKPEIIYTISYRQIVLLYPFFKKNIIYHIHDPNSQSKQSSFFLKLIDSKVVKYIAVSNFIKKDLVKIGIDSDKIEVIHNGVEIPNYKTKNYLSGSCVRVGVVGQIIPRKGHSDILEALYIIKKRYSIFIELHVFGTGNEDYIKTLKRYISDASLSNQVYWHGFVKEVRNIYSNIDLILAPTKNEEPFALVALEAGAWQLASIVTNSGGFTESIVDMETGFIIPKNNPEAIVQSLLYFQNNPTALKKMGDNAYSRVSTLFSIECMKNKLILFFNSINLY